MFETLVVSGGSTKGILFLGALHFFYLKGSLDQINSYFGTSVGSIICLLLAVGYHPLDLVTCFEKINFSFELLVSKQDVQVIDYDAVIECIETIFTAKPSPSYVSRSL